MIKNWPGFTPTALVTLKVPVGLKWLVAMLVQLVQRQRHIGRGEDIVGVVTRTVGAAEYQVAPESVTRSMAGTGTAVETTTRFKLPPLTDSECVVPDATPAPVTVTAGCRD